MLAVAEAVVAVAVAVTVVVATALRSDDDVTRMTTVDASPTPTRAVTRTVTRGRTGARGRAGRIIVSTTTATPSHTRSRDAVTSTRRVPSPLRKYASLGWASPGRSR